VGTRDLTLKVFESIEGTELLVHGITISPGKPTIIARKGCNSRLRAARSHRFRHGGGRGVSRPLFGKAWRRDDVWSKAAEQSSRQAEPEHRISERQGDDFIRVRLIQGDVGMDS